MVTNAIFEKYVFFFFFKLWNIFISLIMLTGPGLPLYTLHNSGNDKGNIFIFYPWFAF